MSRSTTKTTPINRVDSEATKAKKTDQNSSQLFIKSSIEAHPTNPFDTNSSINRAPGVTGTSIRAVERPSPNAASNFTAPYVRTREDHTGLPSIAATIDENVSRTKRAVVIQPRSGSIRKSSKRKSKLHILSSDSIRSGRKRGISASTGHEDDIDETALSTPSTTSRKSKSKQKGSSSSTNDEEYYEFPFATWQRGRRFDEDEMPSIAEAEDGAGKAKTGVKFADEKEDEVFIGCCDAQIPWFHRFHVIRK